MVGGPDGSSTVGVVVKCGEGFGEESEEEFGGEKGFVGDVGDELGEKEGGGTFEAVRDSLFSVSGSV